MLALEDDGEVKQEQYFWVGLFGFCQEWWPLRRRGLIFGNDAPS